MERHRQVFGLTGEQRRETRGRLRSAGRSSAEDLPIVFAGLMDILGPVFTKEVVEIGRRKRFYVNRCIYGLALFGVLLVFTDEYGSRLTGTDGQSRWLMARAASELFIAVSVIQFAAVFVFVPLFTCAVIAGERESHTLDLLFTTTLSDRQIVLGKLVSRLVVLATLVLSGLPVLSLVLFFGGVDPDSLWRSAGVTLLATIFVGAHAIYFSAVTKSPLGALVRTYWWLALELVAIPAVVGIVAISLPGAIGLTPDRIAATLAMVNPIALFAISIEDTLLARLTGMFGAGFFTFGFILPSACAAFLIYRAVRCLRHEPAPFRLPVRIRLLIGRAAALLPKVRLPLRSRNAPVDGNPLWVRARRAAVYDREGYIRRVQMGGWLIAATFFVLVAAFAPNDLDDEELSIAFGGFAWTGVAVLAALISGASLAGERRRGFLDIILVTPLTAREVIDGTLLAVWEHLRCIVWLPIVLAVVFCVTTASMPHGAIASIVTALLFLTLTVLYGVGCSLSARSVTAGLATAFAFPLAVNVVTAMLIGVFEEDHAVVLWLLTIGLYVIGYFWIRRRVSCGSVFCFLLGTHLVLACIATAWTTDFRRDQYPAAAMHAGFLTAVMLDDNFAREFRPWPPVVILLCYWAVLVINVLWVRRWLITNFDRLVGRYELTTYVSSFRVSLNTSPALVTGDIEPIIQLENR